MSSTTEEMSGSSVPRPSAVRGSTSESSRPRSSTGCEIAGARERRSSHVGVTLSLSVRAMPCTVSMCQPG
jgi:hypothetical protein